MCKSEQNPLGAGVFLGRLPETDTPKHRPTLGLWLVFAGLLLSVAGGLLCKSSIVTVGSLSLCGFVFGWILGRSK